MRSQSFDVRECCRRLWYDGRLYVANRIIGQIPLHWVRLLFYRKVLKIRIGKGSSIFMDAWFDTVGNLTIGENTTINQKCRLDARGGLTIGNNVSISAEVCILTADHDIQSADFRGRSAPVHIHDYVFAGTRAMILPGVSLYKGAVVAAGSVVTRDAEALTVVAGIPARAIGTRSPHLEYNCSYRRLFF
jgi:acetyltransferase-like isoleucine patch superfamily enzyme